MRKLIATVLCLQGLLGAALAVASAPARIVDRVDDLRRVELKGELPRALRDSVDLGAADPLIPTDRVVMLLRAGPEQEAQLAQFLHDVQTRGRPEFHRWLTPAAFGQRFGVSPQDVETVRGWLQSKGFRLDATPAGRRALVFSGTVAQMDAAFQTRLREYRWHGERHLANSAAPTIPQALAPVVRGFASLHDFQLRPQFLRGQANLTNGNHALAPADFATIYDLTPSYGAGNTGAGSTIAVIGRSNIKPVDLSTFRSMFGLPASVPEVILAGADPGLVSGDQTESDLDLEWAGAVAPAATVKFVIAQSTSTTDGIAIAAQYAVDQNLADVITVSYGACESSGDVSGGTTFFHQLWQQAAAQGTSVFVSSGDAGAAGCDAAGSATASHGLGINLVCSSPYSTCVGGTQFSADVSSPGTYWSTANGTGYGSALQYIGESVWNQSGLVSGGSALWSSGGGFSLYYAKPDWQLATGVPSDGRRDVPDVSLTASSAHVPYLIYSSDGNTSSTLEGIGGTSAAAPSMAAIAALIVQRRGGRVGNFNPVLYGLSELQAAGGGAVFHRITSGNNSVPGQVGYAAGPSDPQYSQASGLGSVDAGALLAHWSDFQGTKTGLSPVNATVPAATTVGSASLVLPPATAWSAAIGGGGGGWLSVSPASGVGSAALTFSAAANSSAASRSGTITINGQTLTVIQTAAAGSAGQWSLSAASLGFGPDSVGVTTPAQTLLISNSGGTSMTVGTISVTGSAGADYQYGGSCVAGLVLVSGASCYLKISFDPTSSGARSATLQIGTLSVPLSGIGTQVVAGDAPLPLWAYALMAVSLWLLTRRSLSPR